MLFYFEFPARWGSISHSQVGVFLENPMVQGDVEPQQPAPISRSAKAVIGKSGKVATQQSVKRFKGDTHLENFFVRRPKKRIGASKLVHLTPWHLPASPQKKKNAAGIYEYNPGRFFWLDFVWQKYWWVPTKKRIGPTWKKPGSWKLAPRNKNNRKTMVILSWPDIPKPWALAFSFYFPPVYWGKRRKKQLPQTNNLKTTLSSDSESRSSPFTANVVKGFPGRFCCPQTFWTSSHVEWPSLVAGRLARSRMFLKHVQKVGCWWVKSMEQYNDWVEEVTQQLYVDRAYCKVGKSNQKIDDLSFYISILYPFVTFDGWGWVRLFPFCRESGGSSGHKKNPKPSPSRRSWDTHHRRNPALFDRGPLGWELGNSPRRVGCFCFHSWRFQWNTNTTLQPEV